MKILTIIGARPQFIKAGTVSREIKKYSDIQEVIVHTGQHFDDNMSQVFFDQMEIPKPDYHLGIGGLSHGAMTGQMIEAIENVALKEQPDFLMVYGDTNSTLAGAIVASKLHIKLAHIEAGLRSFNMKMPEEVNRILTDRVSDILFCPSQAAMNNLKDEGFDHFNNAVIHSGDVMYDGALFYANKAIMPEGLSLDSPFVLCTVHRAENTDSKDNLSSIFKALYEINKRIRIVLPLHPRTAKKLKELNIEIPFSVIEPVGYLEMIWLIKNSSFVITDSGGLQKEAFFFKKYCLTMREETEWTELVDLGVNSIVGSDKNEILAEYERIKGLKGFPSTEPYGNGNAAERILNAMLTST